MAITRSAKAADPQAPPNNYTLAPEKIHDTIIVATVTRNPVPASRTLMLPPMLNSVPFGTTQAAPANGQEIAKQQAYQVTHVGSSVNHTNNRFSFVHKGFVPKKAGQNKFRVGKSLAAKAARLSGP